VSELPDGLSIGELARRTQVPAPTLRSWEDRYGFPRPHRLAGGHRRYDHGDIALIEAVVRLRASGMSLQAAISQAASQAAEAEPSVFAGLRRRHPALPPQVLRKVTLLALTRAIEDECCARAERPVLFASFQRQRFFRQSEERWNELTRTARVVVVFADFSSPAEASGRPPGEPAPIRVPLPEDAPARREWTLVCESRDYPACVTGWEFPGQREAADSDRRFEVLWSVDPQVVNSATAICAQLARSARPGLGYLLGALPSEPAPPASADLRRAAGLLSRMTGYLEKAAERQGHHEPLPGGPRMSGCRTRVPSEPEQGAGGPQFQARLSRTSGTRTGSRTSPGSPSASAAVRSRRRRCRTPSERLVRCARRPRRSSA
jgi:DICT domain-containing protein